MVLMVLSRFLLSAHAASAESAAETALQQSGTLHLSLLPETGEARLAFV